MDETCRCDGVPMEGSDHCPECGCEEGEEMCDDYPYDDDYDDEMDGDHASALASAGWGTDEDYGYYGDDHLDDYGD